MNKKNAKEWASIFSCSFLEQGLVSYEDSGAGVALLRKETIDRMLNSILGKPVIIDHQDATPENFADMAVGYVSDAFFNPDDGWFHCKFVLIDDEAKAMASKGFSVSCAYDVKATAGGGEWHAIPYDEEITDGAFTHLALVASPRYEACKIYVNSKKAEMTKHNSTVLKEEKALGRECKYGEDVKVQYGYSSGEGWYMDVLRVPSLSRIEHKTYATEAQAKAAFKRVNDKESDMLFGKKNEREKYLSFQAQGGFHRVFFEGNKITRIEGDQNLGKRAFKSFLAGETSFDAGNGDEFSFKLENSKEDNMCHEHGKMVTLPNGQEISLGELVNGHMEGLKALETEGKDEDKKNAEDKPEDKKDEESAKKFTKEELKDDEKANEKDEEKKEEKENATGIDIDPKATGDMVTIDDKPLDEVKKNEGEEGEPEAVEHTEMLLQVKAMLEAGDIEGAKAVLAQVTADEAAEIDGGLNKDAPDNKIQVHATNEKEDEDKENEKDEDEDEEEKGEAKENSKRNAGYFRLLNSAALMGEEGVGEFKVQTFDSKLNKGAERYGSKK